MKQMQPFQKHWLQINSIVVCRLNSVCILDVSHIRFGFCSADGYLFSFLFVPCLTHLALKRNTLGHLVSYVTKPSAASRFVHSVKYTRPFIT